MNQTQLHTLTNLNKAPTNRALVVADVRVPDDVGEWKNWLEELGFIAGESVWVKRRALLPKGSLVVRVGHSTFALHDDEAACVTVTLEEARK